MRRTPQQAFTVIELLVVTAVVALLAAILVPVFTRTKVAATQTSCLGRFRQVTQATHLYLSDYDDVFMPVNHQPGAAADATTDRTWVEILLPYTGSFAAFHCPADQTGVQDGLSVFDQDLVPGDLSARFYNESMHVNLGYNFQYLAPIVKSGTEWLAQPKNLEALADPSAMLLFIDSAWNASNGSALDGGSWLVAPPCRYQEVAGKWVDTIASSAPVQDVESSANVIFAPTPGWQPSVDVGQQYGGAWPWHSGRLSVSTVGGGARSMSIGQLGSGCQILPAWSGSIVDRHAYLWSPD